MSRQSSHRPTRSVVATALATVALLLAACSPTTAELTDPAEILQAGAASLGEMETVHLRGAIDGEIPLELGGIGGGAFHAAVPAEVGVGAVGVALVVGDVVLEVVRHQIVQREAVVTSDEVDAVYGKPALRLIEVAAPGQS